MAYEQPKVGQWVQPVKCGYKLACCDCGLVHRLDFRVYRGRAQFRVFESRRSTGQIRRWMTAQGRLRVREAPRER